MLTPHPSVRCEQSTGNQDLSERNLIKVSLDYYIQGFCLSSLTLRPSAFYAAAGLRTVSIRGAIWNSIRANLTERARTVACVATEAEGRRRGGPPPLDACQWDLCGLRDCNLNQ